MRVCADPNNLPFSNARGDGFENALAQLIARDLKRTVQYTWWPQRRGFIRNTLRANKCDVVMGIPSNYKLARPTLPYYRSTYAFVTRLDGSAPIESLDDPRLHRLRIGIHVIGDDYNNVPPAQMLAARGIVENLRGYSIYGDYSKPNPPRELIDAVASNDVDVAIAWGPIAGYFAQKQPVALLVTPMTSASTGLAVPMAFDISMGVRPEDDALRRDLDAVLLRRRHEIQKLLVRYRIPVIARPAVIASLNG
ncbi:MAG TPA: substrate-binding domain-containing protein [Burkholderiales bacterium]|nr:substrate-binding domain-containing protein [Burkholderiales bacterium]